MIMALHRPIKNSFYFLVFNDCGGSFSGIRNIIRRDSPLFKTYHSCFGLPYKYLLYKEEVSGKEEEKIGLSSFQHIISENLLISRTQYLVFITSFILYIWR